MYIRIDVSNLKAISDVPILGSKDGIHCCTCDKMKDIPGNAEAFLMRLATFTVTSISAKNAYNTHNYVDYVDIVDCWTHIRHPVFMRLHNNL